MVQHHQTKLGGLLITVLCVTYHRAQPVQHYSLQFSTSRGSSLELSQSVICTVTIITVTVITVTAITVTVITVTVITVIIVTVIVTVTIITVPVITVTLITVTLITVPVIHKGSPVQMELFGRPN